MKIDEFYNSFFKIYDTISKYEQIDPDNPPYNNR